MRRQLRVWELIMRAAALYLQTSMHTLVYKHTSYASPTCAWARTHTHTKTASPSPSWHQQPLNTEVSCMTGSPAARRPVPKQMRTNKSDRHVVFVHRSQITQACAKTKESWEYNRHVMYGRWFWSTQPEPAHESWECARHAVLFNNFKARSSWPTQIRVGQLKCSRSKKRLPRVQSTVSNELILETKYQPQSFHNLRMSVKKCTDTQCVLRETGQMPIFFYWFRCNIQIWYTLQTILSLRNCAGSPSSCK